MSAKSLMVNEGYLQEMEKRILEVREKGGALVRAMAGKTSFADGVTLVAEYAGAAEILQEMSKLLFSPMDLCDPEDNELLEREQDAEENEEDDEENEESDDEDSEENEEDS